MIRCLTLQWAEYRTNPEVKVSIGQPLDRIAFTQLSY